MIDENEIKNKMDKVVENLESRFTQIRAGRANPNILHGVMVDYYGVPTPIESLATISVPEARVLAIKPFDKSSLKNIEKAIHEANLGIAPTNNGEVIMLTVPELTGDTRRQYVKDAEKMSEEAKIALRNIRQDENNKIKKDEELREDERDMCLEIVQEIIDKYNKIVEEKLKEKVEELTSI
jgi:ribosome recycling factor